MERKFEILFGIIVLGIIAYIVYYVHNYKKNIIKRLDKLSNTDQSLNQIVRIEKSKMNKSNEKTIYDKYKSIVLIIMFLISGVYLLSFKKVSANMSEIVMYILLGLLFTYLVLLGINKNYIEKSILFKFKNELEKHYGTLKEIETSKSEMVEGKPGKEYSIRNKCLFCYRIENYHCYLMGCHKERLIRMNTNTDGFGKKNYIKMGLFLEYIYDINPVDFIGLENLQSVIRELSKTRKMDVKVEKNRLIVTKETVLYGYDENDSIIDSDDVKIFYEELVKKKK